MSAPVWKERLAEADAPKAASTVVQRLTASGIPFCLWLRGPLGAGKTTLTGHMLRALGLPERLPVTSPTYTYMNEYRIGEKWYAHLDLYRAKAGFSPEELGLLDARSFLGTFVEWPERAPDEPALQPSHVLEIAFAEDGRTRDYTLYDGATYVDRLDAES